MRTTQYVRQERAIAAGVVADIRARWFWGLRILRDPEAMTESGKSLRHGVSDQLITAARARGLKLSEREIRRRIQCARTYQKESQIGQALADFETWEQLSLANFPPYQAPLDEPGADHRTESEKRHDRARQMLDRIGDQGSLFPEFEPAEVTIKEMRAYAEEQREITARFAAHDEKRFAYLDRLSEVVGGDESVTWEAAQALLPDDEVQP